MNRAGGPHRETEKHVRLVERVVFQIELVRLTRYTNQLPRENLPYENPENDKA
jgi:hypothetical protein